MATAITTVDQVIFTLVILVAMAAGVVIDSHAQPVGQPDCPSAALPGSLRAARSGSRLPSTLGVKTERMKYCPECGNILGAKRIDGVERKACVSLECGFVHWDNPVPVVAALIEYQGKIVLARNSQWPEDMFSLVTGFLEKNETPEEAVVREVKEELGLDGKVKEFMGCYSFIERNQIILAHWVVATGELKTGNEIAEAKLLSREELKLWRFGRLALTSAIAKQWLEKTTPNKALQPTSPLTRRRV